MQLPLKAAEDDSHSHHLYILRLTDAVPISRDDFILALKAEGIGTSVRYRPLHQMTFWKNYCGNKSFPVADAIFDTCVSLPLFMDMCDDEQERVIAVVRQVLGRCP